jgi:hypothetical protein
MSQYFPHHWWMVALVVLLVVATLSYFWVRLFSVKPQEGFYHDWNGWSWDK